MITKKIAMTMTFVATQKQTYKFVIFVVLLEHRGTNFALLAIKFAGTEQTFIAPKHFSVYLVYKVYFLRKTKDTTGKLK